MYAHIDLLVIPDTPDKEVAKSPGITKKSPRVIGKSPRVTRKSPRITRKNTNHKRSPTTKSHQWLTTRKGYGLFY